MNTLFGISMDTIMAVTLALFGGVTLVVVLLALRNPLLLRLGLRNIPRRRAQTVLIVVGLMLSTAIVTSAFGTGDTMSYSIRDTAVTSLGRVDEVVVSNATAAGPVASAFPAAVAGRIGATLAPSHDADGVTGALVESVALQDLTTRQTGANVELLGVPAAFPAAFGALTTASGATAQLSSLGADGLYLNQGARQTLDAHPGDRIHLFIAGRPVSFVVRDVLQSRNLAGGGLIFNVNNGNPAVILPLDRVQAATGQPGRINAVLIANHGDALSGAGLTDNVTSALRASLANPAQVRAAQSLLTTPTGLAALHALENDQATAARTRTTLRELETELRRPGQSDRLKSLLSDPAVIAALQTVKDPTVGAPLNNALASLAAYTVQTPKQDGLTFADAAGTEFSSVFIVFGLFSIAAGIMLIFLIFVMLAAERRAEMGMARSIGTKRRHLIQQFLFEGYAYDLGAALVGIAVGIGVGLGMVSVIAALVGNFGFVLQPQVAPRSVVVAFCLGALVTFLTVAFSSWRVSRLTIVAAIRDLPEDLRVDSSIGAAFRRPLLDLRTAWRRLRRGHVLGSLAATLAAPWHFVTAFRVFIGRGPLLLLGGYLLVTWGLSGKQLFPFNLGISLLLIGAAMLVRWALAVARVPERLRNRIGFSLAGLVLVVFWLLPFDAIRSDLQWDIEMFFLAGLMLVLGGVWTVMYNSDLLLGALLFLFGRVGSLAPALKMAVTYPLQNRVRTGLTLSMFSLVIFTLMVMSVLTTSFGSIGLNLNRDIGGYQIYGSSSSLNPIRDIAAAARADPTLRGHISSAGSIAQIEAGLRQPSQRDQSWQPFGLDVADDAYLAGTRYTLHTRANGYGSDAQVWQALRAHPGYAVVMGDLVHHKTGNGNGRFQIMGFSYEDRSFAPARISMRDMRTGAVIPLTVIGVLDGQANFADAIYTGQSTLAAARDAPATPTAYYFRVAPGQDVHRVALALGSAFLPNGLSVTETRVQYDQQQATGVGLNTLLEGFMALGLVVGIAALGVVATRSVVERRQQIGLLRAIGFKRRMVQASFLLESSLITLIGTALGVALGLPLAAQLIAHFARTSPGLEVVIPWLQVAGIVALAYLASLLTTYLPAWQASRIYPAEALRYE